MAFRFPPAAVLRFSGEDHFEFLQGQGTADLRGPSGLLRYSLWLDHRGLIQGDGFVLKESDDAMLLVSYDTPAADLIAKFDRHIIADDVEIEDLTVLYEVVSIASGEIPDSVSESAAWPALQDDAFVRKGDVCCFHGRRLGMPSIDFLLPTGVRFPGELEWVDRSEADGMRVSAGVPSIPADTDGRSLNPMEANILSALSFDKGCYLGQEVVARIHRLDRLTRRLVRVTGKVGAGELIGPLTMDGKPVGGITSVVISHDTFTGIGWLKSRFEDGDLSFDNGPVSVETLPAS